MKMARFGAKKSVLSRVCSYPFCQSMANIAIGDMEAGNGGTNYHLCSKHAQVLLEEMKKLYGVPTNDDVIDLEKEIAAHKETEFIKATLKCGGRLDKKTLYELCKELKLDVPNEMNDETTIKEYLKLVFPTVEGGTNEDNPN